MFSPKSLGKLLNSKVFRFCSCPTDFRFTPQKLLLFLRKAADVMQNRGVITSMSKTNGPNSNTGQFCHKLVKTLFKLHQFTLHEYKTV